MKDLLDKISSYNIFNYLFPGVLLAVFLDWATPLRPLQMNVAVGAFVYYFLGAVVSRVGSLLVEPALKGIGFLKFAPYGDFVRAEKLDPKLEILSETNNMYRTLCALLVTIALVWAYQLAAEKSPILQRAAPSVVVVGLFALFVASYRKQTGYIRRRIATRLHSQDDKAGS